jgi:phosphoribosyl-AMP cyclohydrolase
MKQLRTFTHANALISGFLLVVLVLDLAGVTTLTGLFLPQVADAAVVVVDSNVNSSARTNNHTGAQTVFISDSTGYTFYRDSAGECVYSKTTNSGNSWGTAVTVDAQTDCIRIVVWYDQWTPGGTGDTIHIATMDTSEDGLFC